ncbi:MAG: ABC transporter ATP-binding protein, partial [Syntrophales bacterium]|nr:ABC transporter ATP-binding protein [Syntrophales bacterium]
PAVASPTMVKISRVSKRFGDISAVRDVSLEVKEGNIFGLVGSDGAGKSTLLRMLATMLVPDEGGIWIDGKDIVAQRRRVKSLIGYMPQRFGLYSDLTVEENLQFFMDVFGIPPEERKGRRERYLGFSHLLPFTDRLAGNLSGGMKQKLGLACVLVHEPRLLILDEPTNGVDPVSRREFWEILAAMRQEGMTIVIATAYLDEVAGCDMIAVMHKGRLIAMDKPASVQGDYINLEEAMIARIGEADPEVVRDVLAMDNERRRRLVGSADGRSDVSPLSSQR